MTTVQPPQPQPQVIMMYAVPQGTLRAPRIYVNLASGQMKVLGICQVAIGVLCFVFNIAAISMAASMSSVSEGFWCGAFFILAGSFGIAASRGRTACSIIACMVLSIIAAVMTSFLLSFSSIGVSVDASYYGYYYDHYYSGNMFRNVATKQAMNGVLVALSLLEAIVAIWQASLCCSAMCCCNYNTSGQIIQNPGGQVQYMYTTAGWPGQQIYMPAAPGTQQPAMYVTTGVPGQAVGQQVYGPVAIQGHQQPAYFGGPNQPAMQYSGPAGYNAAMNLTAAPMAVPPAYGTESVPPPYYNNEDGTTQERDQHKDRV